jgi:hypothetical protein
MLLPQSITQESAIISGISHTPGKRKRGSLLIDSRLGPAPLEGCSG